MGTPPFFCATLYNRRTTHPPPGMIEAFLIILASFAIGIALGTITVTKLVWEPLRRASARDDYVVAHEDLYLEDIEALERRPLDAARRAELGALTTVDATPYGAIHMSYFAAADHFGYWSDVRDVPYKNLDAVARRFCVEHDCRSVYVDMYESLYLGTDGGAAQKALDRSFIMQPDFDDAPEAETAAAGPAAEAETTAAPAAATTDEATAEPPAGSTDGPTDGEPAASAAADDGVFARFKRYNAPAERAAGRGGRVAKYMNAFRYMGRPEDRAAGAAREMGPVDQDAAANCRERLTESYAAFKARWQTPPAAAAAAAAAEAAGEAAPLLADDDHSKAE